MTTSPTATSVVSLALIETLRAGAAVCTVTNSVAVPVTSLVPPGEDPVTVTSLTICAYAAAGAAAAIARAMSGMAALCNRLSLTRCCVPFYSGSDSFDAPPRIVSGPKTARMWITLGAVVRPV